MCLDLTRAQSPGTAHRRRWPTDALWSPNWPMPVCSHMHYSARMHTRGQCLSTPACALEHTCTHTHTNTCIYIHIHICVIIKNLSVENHGSPVMGIFSLLNFYLYRQENFVGLLLFRFQKPKGVWRHGSVAKSTCCSYSRFDIGSGHSCQVAFNSL